MNNEPEVIRARFVEAAATERFLPAARGPQARGYWPEFFYDDEDKKGWDDAAHLDNAEKWKGRASSAAISRHQECMDWTASFIDPAKPLTNTMVKVLWAWSFCRANGWDFGARCVRRGWTRPTAYRRLTATIDAFSSKFAMEGVVVRLPDDKWIRHESPSVVSIDGGLEKCATAPAIKFTPGYQLEKSCDLLTSEAAVTDFMAHLDQVNAERRKFQERDAKRREAKRREKLGLAEAV